MIARVTQKQTQLKQLSMPACTGGGNGNPPQYSCLENSMVRESWLAAVHGGCKDSDMFEATKYACLQHSFGACPMVLRQVTSF